MGNVVENVRHVTTLIGKTIKIDDGNNSTALIIPKEFAKALGIENSKVSMSLLDDFSGNRCLIVSKHYNEIVID
jgi:hypothetical protein